MVAFCQSVEIVSRNQFQELGEYGIDVGQGSRPSDVSGVSRNNTLAIVCDAEPCDLSNHGTVVGLTPLSKMTQGERPSGFEGLDGDVAAHFSDDGQAQELADEEPLIVLQVGDDHLQEIVGFA